MYHLNNAYSTLIGFHHLSLDMISKNLPSVYIWSRIIIAVCVYVISISHHLVF